MTKRQESSADRVWKEKLEEGGSLIDAIALLLVVVVLGALMFLG